MKKLLFFVLVSAALTGCNDKKKDETTVAEPQPSESSTDVLKPGGDCETLFTTLGGMTVAQQIVWLRNNQGLLCSDYLPCIEKIHMILPPNNYDDMVSDHWGTNPPVYSEYTFKDVLKDTECGYDAYIEFTADQHNNITFNRVPTFSNSSTKSCYSVLLFKSILENHTSIDENTKLKFTKGNNGNTTILFSVDGLPGGFYDYSDKPGFIDKGKLPI